MSRPVAVNAMILVCLVVLSLVSGCGDQGSPQQTAPPSGLTASPSVAASTTATAKPTSAPPTAVATTTAKPSFTLPPPTPTPRPAEFKVSSLTISPADVLTGKPATVSAEIANSGQVDGTYAAKLTIDKEPSATKEVTVAAGTSQKVSFPTSFKTAGGHTVEVGGMAQDIKVLKSPELTANWVKLTPSVVFPGQDVAVEAEVVNSGDVKGNAPAMLNVNGIDVDSQTMALEPGATAKVSFTMVRDAAGAYTVKIGRQSSQLTVADVKTYTSKTYNFSFAYPADWSLEEDGSVISVSKTGVYLVVAADTLDTQTTPADFASLVADTLRKQYSAQLVSQTEVRKDGSVYGYQQDYTMAVSGQALKASQLLVKRGRYGFEVGGTVMDSLWSSNKPLVDAFIASFKPPVVATGSYTGSIHGYSLALPSGWDGIETTDTSMMLKISGPRTAKSGPIVGFVGMRPLSKEMTARDFASSRIDELKKGADGFKIVSQRDVLLSGGQQAYDVVLTYSYRGTSLQSHYLGATRGSQGWEFYFAATTSDYSANQSTGDQLFSSFKFVEPKPFGVSRQDSMFGYGGEIVTIDPAVTEEGPEAIVGAIFSGLVKLGADLKPTGDIADKWEVSADGKTYTFHIRDGAKFHNGRPVTAADVKYSWERASDPVTKSDKAPTYLGDIVGVPEMLAGQATEITGVKVLDDSTLQVTIDGPKPYFTAKLAQPAAYIVDKANVARGMNWTTAANGTGPFKVKQWKKDDLLVLERNDYHYETIQIKNVVFQLFAGRPMMMYERGEIDQTGVGTYDLDRVQDPSNPLNKELLTGKSFNTGYVGFNVTKVPFDDPGVRKAFALALDLSKIIEVSMHGESERASGYVPPCIPGNNPDLKPLPFDPAQARDLLAKSKYGGPEKLPPVTVYVYGSAGSSIEAMIGMWKQNIGVDVKVEAVKELKEYYNRKHSRDFQLFVAGWHADYLDPQNFLELFFQSQSKENEFAYANPSVDAALKAAAVEPDPVKRLQKYQEIEKTVLADLPAVPFYQNSKRYLLVKPYLRGLKMYPLAVNHWKDISIAPH